MLLSHTSILEIQTREMERGECVTSLGAKFVIRVLVRGGSRGRRITDSRRLECRSLDSPPVLVQDGPVHMVTSVKVLNLSCG